MNGTVMLWLVTLLYGAQAAQYLFDGRAPLALVVVGYVIANLGLIWASLGKGIGGG